ncbi:unnamed protein product [marine sediment metagenome]|uniref:Uncharacterized protein n=1 Tax=marine sediment metagenome TaxID=412755 RepID=X0ULP1_9ZZZZ
MVPHWIGYLIPNISVIFVSNIFSSGKKSPGFETRALEMDLESCASAEACAIIGQQLPEVQPGSGVASWICYPLCH